MHEYAPGAAAVRRFAEADALVPWHRLASSSPRPWYAVESRAALPPSSRAGSWSGDRRRCELIDGLEFVGRGDDQIKLGGPTAHEQVLTYGLGEVGGATRGSIDDLHRSAPRQLLGARPLTRRPTSSRSVSRAESAIRRTVIARGGGPRRISAATSWLTCGVLAESGVLAVIAAGESHGPAGANTASPTPPSLTASPSRPSSGPLPAGRGTARAPAASAVVPRRW
jgi:hypothetical protein